MELMIALAAEEQSLMISTRVRSILEKSYSSLFANVYFRVFDITERSHSDIVRVKNMDQYSVPVVVTLEDQNHNKVTVVAEIPKSSVGFNKTTDDAVIHFDGAGKHETIKLERRVIQIRGMEYAIASTIARNAHKYLNFAL